MHSSIDPGIESRELYVEQARMVERLREDPTAPLVLWDVGLGAAHNAMAALTCCESSGNPEQRPVRIVSFENDAASLRLALRNADRFPHLQCAAPNHVLRFGEWRSERVPLVWTFLEGDFLDRMEDAPTPDLIFYDPFSAKTDTTLWTLACFERLYAACAGNDAELFTYSASTAVRTALLAAGFFVGVGAPTGSRPETTLALTPRAVRRATARGRTLLDERWLGRWRRSHAPFPSDVGVEDEAPIRERIERHEQFVDVVASD